MIYLPDTNAVSNFLRGNNPALTARMHQEFPCLRLSALVVAEREFGSLHHRSGLKYRRAFEALVSSVPIEVFSRDDAAHYAELRS